jgi:hypothetical protein
VATVYIVKKELYSRPKVKSITISIILGDVIVRLTKYSKTLCLLYCLL